MSRFAPLALASLLLSSVPASAGPCAIPSIRAAPVFDGESIAAGGGVIVALGAGGFDGAGKQDTSPVKADWRFRDVAKAVAPASIDEIAPGLAVYRLPPAGGAELVLEDGKGKALSKTRRALAAVPVLDAPKLRAVRRVDGTSGGPRPSSFTQIIAEVPGAAPKNAAMLVLYRLDASGARLPLTWVSVQPAAKDDFIVYVSPGRCSMGTPGLSPANVSDRVVVAWLDRSGRLSPVSNVVNVQVPSGPPGPTLPHP